jgi:hypothetical protein
VYPNKTGYQGIPRKNAHDVKLRFIVRLYVFPFQLGRKVSNAGPKQKKQTADFM